MTITNPRELTATVTTTEIKAGLRYTITLSNGWVVTRQSSQPKAALAFDLRAVEAINNGEKGWGCHTTVRKDLPTMLREMGGFENTVIVDLQTGRLYVAADLPKHVKGQSKARTARNDNGMTEAQAKQFERFCNAPARLVKSFLKTADYYASCGSSDHLNKLIEKHHNAAERCRQLIGNRDRLLNLWHIKGFRTSGDLEMWIERTMAI